MQAKTEICAARHGETDWNVTGVLQGWTDVMLNELGRKQAVDMATAMAGEGFTRIYSSPLLRAAESAQIIARKLGLPEPDFHEGLKERHFGAIQGTPKSELAELNPRLLQQILIRNPAAEFELGETMDEFADRVLAAIADVGVKYPGERVLVITHGWVLDVLSRHIEQQPRSAVLGRKPKNGEYLWLETEAGRISRRTEPVSEPVRECIKRVA